ncbi:hypothetical protein B0T20DRAFT_391713 [Sordaria brevicollis]|uniref:Uncharacterized protein n=1 Tax=Sordaria brevicollis TaxID=83679 RepID=A0AAE0PHZ9_SORBR|nr:hypothetical protein B0T20DRAFT_391713 [Sordaria brevicollis]
MASIVNELTSHENEYPPQVDLREMFKKHPVPIIAPGTVDPASMAGDEATQQALAVVNAMNEALVAEDARSLEGLFFPGSAYWKDSLALTYHLRTFNGAGVVAAALLETKRLRGIESGIQLEGAAQFIPATPVLHFIDCSVAFKTCSPAASCSGRILLLPLKKDDGSLEWKIWILSTRLEGLDLQPEDETLLKAPGKQLEGVESFETEVFIIGGGNAAVALSARLKALGVESVMAEKNARPGDNWANRYDCMKFHIPTTFCHLPFMDYAEELTGKHMLTRDDLAGQVRKYVEAFNLNMITTAKIKSTVYDGSSKRWTIKFQTPGGQRTAIAKHVVQATGISSHIPYIPTMPDSQLYKGLSIHSEFFNSGRDLKAKGVKSVIVVGSANTAFDVLEDCHAAGLQATMNVRSPTYIVPVEYVCDPRSLGLYDFGVAMADRMFLTMPTFVDGQLARGLFRMLASEEPDRYKPLAEAGFPVMDSAHPTSALMHNLLERAGGHYVDVGGTNLIVEGKVGLKALVEPVGFTETGLKFSDGSVVEADAVVWCTGFADRDVRKVTADILGGEEAQAEAEAANMIGPKEVAARLEGTWGLDVEGEVRGLQIKAELEGVLPPAYRKTPAPVSTANGQVNGVEGVDEAHKASQLVEAAH